MQTFYFIVFLASSVALPFAVIALAKAKMPLPGKTILFAGLAVAARYLLGSVWVPEEMWKLVVKSIVGAVSAWWLFWMLLH